jgi:hypothetical protein
MLRRDALKTVLVSVSTLKLTTATSWAYANASDLPVASAPLKLFGALASTLRETGNEDCVAAAARLQSANLNEGVALHLRSAGLTAANVARIAEALRSLTETEASLLTSLSFSYNKAIGDAGAMAIARALPRSLPELGLVGCKIGDAGGQAVLDWAARATRLTLLCVEGNEYSQDIRARFRDLARTHAGLSVFA